MVSPALAINPNPSGRIVAITTREIATRITCLMDTAILKTSNI